MLICKISFLSFHVPLYGIHSSAPCLQACSMWICSVVLSDSQSAPRAKEPEVQSWGRKKKNPRNPRVVWSLPARSSKLGQSYGVGSLPVFYSFKFQKSSEKNKRTLFCAWIPNPGPSLLWYLSGHLSLVFQNLAVPGSALLFSFSSAVRAPGSSFWCDAGFLSDLSHSQASCPLTSNPAYQWCLSLSLWGRAKAGVQLCLGPSAHGLFLLTVHPRLREFLSWQWTIKHPIFKSL